MKMARLLSTCLLVTMICALGSLPTALGAGDLVFRRPAGFDNTPNFEYSGTWTESAQLLDDGVTKSVLSTAAGASLKYIPGAVSPGYYDVYNFNFNLGSEDAGVRMEMVHRQGDGLRHTVAVVNLTKHSNRTWAKVTNDPIYFSGTGDEYVLFERTSTDSSKNTRGGAIKLVPFTEAVRENTTQQIAAAGTDPWFSTTGTWATPSSLRLYNDAAKQLTLMSNSASAATAVFQAGAIAPGAYKVSFFNPRGGANNEDTNVTIEIAHKENGQMKTKTVNGFNQTLYNNIWVPITDKALIFSGDGTEAVTVKRISTDTAKYTRVGAVKFEAVSQQESGIGNVRISAGGNDIPLGGYREDKTVYHAYIPLNQDTATLSVSTIHPDAAVTVDGAAAADKENIQITGIERGIMKALHITVTAPDGLAEKSLVVNIERAVISGHSLPGTGYSESGTFISPSQPAADYLNTNLPAATRVSQAAVSGSSALWQPPAGKLEPGIYEVFLWKAINSNSEDASPSTQVEIGSEGGVAASAALDLSKGPAQWISVGKHYFTGDGTDYVKAYKTDGYTLRTDAVKFSPRQSGVIIDGVRLYKQVGADYVPCEEITGNGNYKFAFKKTSVGITGAKTAEVIVAEYEKDTNLLLSVTTGKHDIAQDSRNVLDFTNVFAVGDYGNTVYKFMAVESFETLTPVCMAISK